jgi:hypothetical protein
MLARAAAYIKDRPTISLERVHYKNKTVIFKE